MMKAIKRMLLAVVMIFSTAAAAQTTIAGGEYWIDGAINARQVLSSGASIDISTLQPGLHTLTMRVKDSNGLWSNQVARLFFVSPPKRTDATSVTACEYWIDGVKKTAYTKLNTQVIDISGLAPGLHTVMVRIQDDLGIWSNQMIRTFYVTPLPAPTATLTKYMYWIDGDQAHAVTGKLTDNEGELTFDLGELADGEHTLSWCVKDSKDVWSSIVTKTFYVTTMATDEEGNYLLSTAEDWKQFAQLVESNPTANAKMTADIDLGDDQTMVGTESHPYAGTFDGQGHTLTVAYNLDVTGIAPFHYVGAATICNLHTDGSIVNSGCATGGIAGVISGSLTISKCWSSARLQARTTTSQRGTVGGFASYCQEVNCDILIEDCLFSGEIVNNEFSGGFMSHVGVASSSITMRRCLNIGTFPASSNGSGTFIRNISGQMNLETETLFYKQAFGEVQGTQATDALLSDGTVTTVLQAGREEEVWLQNNNIHQPMLKVFMGEPTLPTDEEGNYLLSTAEDWKLFAKLVETNPTANAKMTADIDLGDDQTMVGSYARRYSGTFDGQGHTLTINYDTKDMTNEAGQNYLGAAPFRDVEGATIRNLHTKGTITADKIGATGLIGWTYGTNTIEQCWSEVDITGTNSIADTFAGFVFRQDGSLLTINDCIYTGKIATVRKTSNAGFVGHQVAGTTNINNSLVVLAEGSDESQSSYYTFARNWGNSTPINITNSYYLRPWGTLQGTATATEELADGTTATALQNGRDIVVWKQFGKTPMLSLFCTVIKGDADGDGTVDVNDVTTTINHILGKPVANFVEEAANVDGDKTIDVNDVQGIIDIALGKSK